MRILRRIAGLTALGVALSGALLLPGAAQASAPVLLTNTSNGTTVTVGRGTEVIVALTGRHEAAAEWLWSLPVVSPTGILTLDSEVQSGVDTTAVYTATGYGSANITSVESCRITSTAIGVCPLVVLLWRAGVTVVPLDPLPSV